MPLSAIKEVEIEDIPEFCQGIRQCDINEIKAACGLTPEAVLKAAFYFKGPKISLSMNGETICMFGVTDLLDSHGIPWMIANNKINNYSTPFLKACKVIIPKLFHEYTYLENYVDARNVTSIRWLKWLGFEVLEPEPFGLEGLPFHKFRMFLDV